jgi:hypothetical protein
MKYLSAYVNPFYALIIRGFFLLILNSFVIYIENLTLDVKDPISKFLF